MYEKEFQKNWTELTFEEKQLFFDFLDELDENTEWSMADSSLTLNALDAASIPCGMLISADSQWQEACRNSGISVCFTDLHTGQAQEGVFNKLTAPLSANERAGAKCALTSRFLENFPDCYCRLITKGIRVFGDNVKVLKRGGQIAAIHSGKYNSVSQKEIFKAANKAVSDRFEKSEFVTAMFNPDVTHASYAICDGNDAFMSSYASTWKESGMPEAMLAKTFPIIEFSTSDTGRYTISIRPVLKIGKNSYPIGSELKMKHTCHADIGYISTNIDKCYAKMQTALTTIAELQKQILIHPYAAFVRACMESGLFKVIKGLCRETLDNVKATYCEDDEITAFSMYREICDMQDRTAFRELAPGTALQCLETFSRLLQLNWNEMDKSGPEEF